MDKHIKMQAARVLRSEDVLIMDLKNGFTLAEIEFAYKAAFHALENNMPTEHSTVAKSILSIGMSVLMRSIVVDLPKREDKGEDKKD